MITKEYVVEHYGRLPLFHVPSQDGAFRYVFEGEAPDGASVRVIHPVSLSIWEDFVRTDKPVSIGNAPEYRLCQVSMNGRMEFEEMQSPIF